MALALALVLCGCASAHRNASGQFTYDMSGVAPGQVTHHLLATGAVQAMTAGGDQPVSVDITTTNGRGTTSIRMNSGLPLLGAVNPCQVRDPVTGYALGCAAAMTALARPPGNLVGSLPTSPAGPTNSDEIKRLQGDLNLLVQNLNE